VFFFFIRDGGFIHIIYNELQQCTRTPKIKTRKGGAESIIKAL